MKPFDLEAAKAGAPVMLNDGNQARIICFDRFDSDRYNLIVLSKSSSCERIHSANDDGYISSDYHLVMAPVKKQSWINIYPNGEYSNLHKTEVLAKKVAAKNCIATVIVEWEE